MNSEPLHIHLEPLGGVAGDMFAAAILDTWPELGEGLIAAVYACELRDQIDLRVETYTDNTLCGTRFVVTDTSKEKHHSHRHFGEIKTLLNNSGLDNSVVRHALGIFTLLAEAEARVHGIAVDKVAFHEVGAWDSIADIVAAAYLIDKLDHATWSCDTLPLGRGQVKCAHGILPIPAPATILLLEGMPVKQDEFDGERITPTGAAILKYIQPAFSSHANSRILSRSGMGFGTNIFPGMSNILRVLAFESIREDSPIQHEQLAVMQFDLDDQTPEDLAVSLEHLRIEPGVVDVQQSSFVGKKGRLATQITVLAFPECVDDIAQFCFTATTTLGLRWQIINRMIAKREMVIDTNNEYPIHVKRATRPNGVTAKADIDDVKHIKDVKTRESLRRESEKSALDSVDDK